MNKFTKNDWIKTIIIMTRQFFLICFIICTLSGMLVAHSGNSQKLLCEFKVTIKEKQVPLLTVLKKIEAQTEFKFSYLDEVKDLPRVSIQADNKRLDKVLEVIAKGTKVSFRRVNDMIAVSKVSEKQATVTELITAPINLTIEGKVTDESGASIAGVNVLVKNTTNGTITDVDGNYAIDAEEGDVLSFSFIGFKPVEIEVGKNTVVDVILEEDLSTLDEVVILSTGYQKIPKERATGSYVHVDNKTINRTPGLNVIDRLDGLTPGLLFDKRDPDNPRLQLRGLYTINSEDEPLIVMDNFPYEGDLSSINPNDIEDITILKDAAAASIWGARAGNGVIVITTKKGKFGQAMKLSVSSNISISGKPDLFAQPLLSASEGIEMERLLFDQGYYNIFIALPYIPVSSAVQILNAERNGEITSGEAESQLASLGKRDVRNDYLDHVYRNAVLQTYNGNFSTGGEDVSIYFSAGYDKSLENSIGNSTERVTLRLQNSYRPIDNLTFQLGANYTSFNSENNGKRFGDETLYTGRIPMYTRLVDDQGNALPIEQIGASTAFDESVIDQGGFLDWKYRPLDEIRNADNTSTQTALLAYLNMTYDITDWVSAEVNYQYENTERAVRNFFSTDTYFARDLINQFTDTTTTNPADRYPVPNEGILDKTDRGIESHGARGQLNINNNWGRHEVVALMGAEVRQVVTDNIQDRFYGYNKQRLTSVPVTIEPVPVFTGRGIRLPRIIPGVTILPLLNKTTNRYMSLYANASYTFDKRYSLSASARKDYSNIYGVKLKQKGNPLWSAGASWTISGESFYDFSFIPFLKLRATYGFSGNNPTVPAVTLVRFISPNTETGLDQIDLDELPNPSLQWETVKQFNVGLDFNLLKNERISGSVEYYHKNSTNVISTTQLDPTLGTRGQRALINAVDMAGNGIDIILNTRNIEWRDFQWTSNLSFSSATFKVTKEKSGSEGVNISDGDFLNQQSGLRVAVEGQNPFEVISLPWGGLDPQTGDPRLLLNGEAVHYDSVNAIVPEDFVRHGSAVPVYYGNLLNRISYKGFSLSANITYKFDYYFRRPTVDFQGLVSNYGVGHTDYRDRWQQPGDEQFTDIPSFIYPVPGSSRVVAFQNSEILVEPGDHIRLEDIRLEYNLNSSLLNKLPIKGLTLSVLANNLNILLWRANDKGLDPRFPVGRIFPRQFTFGLKADF